MNLVVVVGSVGFICSVCGTIFRCEWFCIVLENDRVLFRGVNCRSRVCTRVVFFVLFLLTMN